jgi:hypothetical protein
MAKGKGKGRNNNNYNKKKKSGGAGRGSNPNYSADPSTFIKGKIPHFGSHSKADHDNYQTIYSRYKLATNRFIDYMRANVPKEVIAGDRSVNVLLCAADWMAASSYPVNPSVLGHPEGQPSQDSLE